MFTIDPSRCARDADARVRAENARRGITARHVSPFGERHFAERLLRPDRRVVDEDVEPAEARNGRCDQRGRRHPGS
jgi:hypothetical protein